MDELESDTLAAFAEMEPMGEGYDIPKAEGVFFYETFSEGWDTRWKQSNKPKFAGGEWRVGKVEGDPAFKIEQGLIVGKAAQHHAIATKFDKPIAGETGKDLVIQYEVRFHKSHQCGGAYIKLLTDSKDLKAEDFDNETPYTIMFGPDKCGTSDKVHFIFRHQSPVTQKWEEKHLKAPPTIINDKFTHLYTLVVRKDNTFEIFIDQKSVKQGSLLEDFEPPVNPPKEIDDSTDVKPKDWVDEEKIKDPEAKKPEDWDETAPATIPDEAAKKPEKWCDDCPTNIPDPEAEKPDDWDDELDGEWVAPLVENPVCSEVGCGEWQRPNKANPAYKGKWVHPLIPNPAYKGPWVPRQIPNPDYFYDKYPQKLSPIGGLGIEIWTMQEDIEFDDIFIDNSEEKASQFASESWAYKHSFEKANDATSSSSGGGISSWIKTITELPSEKPVIFYTAIVGFVTLLGSLLYWCCSFPAHTLPQEQPVREVKATVVEEEKTTVTKTDPKSPKTDPKSPKSPKSPKAPNVEVNQTTTTKRVKAGAAK